MSSSPENDLRAQRDALLQSLRDLEEEHAAGDLADADYQSLKDDYTARAAAVIRQLDAALPDPTDPLSGANALPGDLSRRKAATGSTDPTEPTQPTGPTADAADPADPHSGANVHSGDRSRRKAEVARPRRSGRVRAVAVVALLAVLSGGIGYAVAQSSGERLEGEQASGDIPETGVDRITRAQVLTSEGKILDAVKVYDEVLEDDPENPVALAQRGWLISRVDPRLVDDGLAQVDQAIALDPTFADAHFFRGMILLRAKEQPAAAAEAFQRGIDARPDPELLTILQQFKAEAEQAASATP